MLVDRWAHRATKTRFKNGALKPPNHGISGAIKRLMAFGKDFSLGEILGHLRRDFHKDLQASLVAKILLAGYRDGKFVRTGRRGSYRYASKLALKTIRDVRKTWEIQ